MFRRLRDTDQVIASLLHGFLDGLPAGRAPFVELTDTQAIAAVMGGVAGPVAAAAAAWDLPVPRALSAHVERTSLRSLASAADLSVVATALSAAEVDWVVLKGMVLSELVFPVPHVRDFTDLDVLVRPGQMRRAVDALTAVGVRPIGVPWDHPEWSGKAEAPLRLPSGTALDLHAHVISGGLMRNVYLEQDLDLTTMAQTVRLSSIRTRIPDDLDLVIHVLLHGCLDGAARWKVFLDAAACVQWLAARGHSPEDLAARATMRGVDVACRATLVRCASALYPEADRWVRAFPRRGVLNGILAIDAGLRPGPMAEADPVRKVHRHLGPTPAATRRAMRTRKAERRPGIEFSRSTVEEHATAEQIAAFDRWVLDCDAGVYGRV